MKLNIKGYEILIDDEDVDVISGIDWYPYIDEMNSSRVYFRKGKRVGKLFTLILLHRMIARTPKGKVTDHINGDTLDNRKENLRICEQPENSRNRKINKENQSGYKGVYWEIRRRKWRATIRANKKKISLGYFNTPEEAHKAYCEASKKYHGEFGRTE